MIDRSENANPSNPHFPPLSSPWGSAHLKANAIYYQIVSRITAWFPIRDH